MFDVSLSELMVIGIVALVVIGPERLPRVARTAGHLLGRLQRYVGQVKSDISREMQLDDLKKFQQQMTEQAGEIKASISGVGKEMSQELSQVESTLNQSLSPPPAVVPPQGGDAASNAVPPAPISLPAASPADKP